MGLFDKLKKEKNNKITKQYDNDLMEIVRIASFNNTNILNHVQDCINNPLEYYNNHHDDYNERGITNKEESSFLQWIGCIDLLINSNYVCECDWKEEKDNFIAQLSKLKGLSSLSLKINDKWLSEEQSIPEWCKILNNKWRKLDSVVGAFDINSDSYLLFICKETNLKTLMSLAKNFGYRIDYAKNM